MEQLACENIADVGQELVVYLPRIEIDDVGPYNIGTANRRSPESSSSQEENEEEAINLYTCSLCLYSAQCKCDLTRHMFWHMDPLNPDMFKCPFCEYRNNALTNDFRLHVTSHKSYSDLKCSVCDYLSKSIQDFRNHLFLHKGTSDVNSFKCPVCQYKTTILTNLYSHIHVHESLLKCSVCDGELLNKNDLAKHILKHKDGNDLHCYKCDFCDYKSKYLSSLTLHYVTHKDLIDDLKCCICNYRCQETGDLNVHMSVHKGPKNVEAFKCYLCNYKTQHLGDLKIHLSTHNLCTSNRKSHCVCLSSYKSLKERANRHRKAQGNRFHCQNCGANYSCKSSLKLHMQNHLDPSQKVLYKCEQCDYKATFKNLFKRHKMKHQKGKCDICDLEMNELDLRKHNEVFHSDSSSDYCRIFQCCLCDCQCETKSDLAKHLLIHKDSACSLCTFKSDKELFWISHMLLHSDTKKKWYRCNHCPYRTAVYEHLKGHENTHKDPSERNLFQCSHCDAKYTSKFSLRHHMQDHLDTSQKITYHCDQCGYQTKFRSVFKKHMPKHQLVKCDVCNLEMNEFNRRRHDDIFHSQSANDSRKPLKCCTCNCKCETKSELAKHLLSHHFNNICSICKYNSKDELSWLSHMLVHSNEDEAKKYQCDLCSFCTTDFIRLKRHKETHKSRSKRNLFKCKHCNSEYTTKSSLKVHLEVHQDGLGIHHCERCDFITLFQSNMRRHELKHRVRQFNCCNMQIDGFDLKIHDEIFHSKSTEDSNTFKCCICDFKTKTKSDLAKHLLSHKNPNNICDLCGCKYDKDVVWMSHMFIHSNVNIPEVYNCEHCPYVTTHFSHLQSHKKAHKKHTGPNLFKCHCGAEFAKNILLKHHMKVHSKQADHRGHPNVTYRCDECDETEFKSRRIFNQHKLKHQTRKCSVCDVEISELDQNKHNEVFHSGRNDSSHIFECCLCDFQCETTSDLAKHLLIHKDSACSLCTFKSDKELSWISHMLLHSTKKRKSWSYCSYCPYRTAIYKQLKGHEDTHKDHSERKLFDPSEKVIYNRDACDYETNCSSLMGARKLKHQSVKCDFCNVDIKNKMELKKHVKKYHAKSPKVLDKCCLCDSRFQTKDDLTKHFLLHKDQESCNFFTCGMCDYNTRYLSFLKLHKKRNCQLGSHEIMNIVHQNEDKVIISDGELQMDIQQASDEETTHRVEREVAKAMKCSSCDFRTKSKNYLILHVKNKHANKVKCCICDHKFTTKPELAKHLLLHKDFKGFKCNSCNHKTRYLTHLKLHLFKHKPVNVETFKCYICHFETTARDRLKRHMEVHKEPSKRKYFECPLCDCRYTAKASLKTHMLKHQDPSCVKLFCCDKCTYETMYKSALNVHKFYMHTDSSKSFKCAFCDVKMKRKQSLTKHVKNVHSETY